MDPQTTTSTNIPQQQQQQAVAPHSPSSQQQQQPLKPQHSHQHIKGPWTSEEDNTLRILVEKYGTKHWSIIANYLPRTGKQCRERWCNYLNPNINKGSWSADEEATIIQTQAKIGNKWAEIAKLLPGRTDNSVKNHWNSMVRKRMRENDRMQRSEIEESIHQQQQQQQQQQQHQYGSGGASSMLMDHDGEDHHAAIVDVNTSVATSVAVAGEELYNQSNELTSTPTKRVKYSHDPLSSSSDVSQTAQQPILMSPVSVTPVAPPSGATSASSSAAAAAAATTGGIFFVPATAFDPNNPQPTYIQTQYGTMLAHPIPTTQTTAGNSVNGDENQGSFQMRPVLIAPQMLPPGYIQQQQQGGSAAANSSQTPLIAIAPQGVKLISGNINGVTLDPNSPLSPMAVSNQTAQMRAAAQLHMQKLKQRPPVTSFSGGLVVENKGSCLLNELGVSEKTPNGLHGSLHISIGNDQFNMQLERKESYLKILRAYTTKVEDKSDKNMNKRSQSDMGSSNTTSTSVDLNQPNDDEDREKGYLIRVDSAFEGKPLMYIPMCGRINNFYLSIGLAKTEEAQNSTIAAAASNAATTSNHDSGAENVGAPIKTEVTTEENSEEKELTEQTTSSAPQQVSVAEPASSTSSENEVPKPSSIIVAKDRKDPIFKKPFNTHMHTVKYDLRYSLAQQCQTFFVSIRDSIHSNNVLFMRCQRHQEYPELVAVNKIEYFVSQAVLPQ